MGANQRSLARRWVDLGRRCSRSARAIPVAMRRFARLPTSDKRTTLRALMILLLVEATIRWTRLPRLARLLGLDLAPGSSPGSLDPQQPVTSKKPSLDADLPTSVAAARRCVYRLMRLWPFGAGPCLRESLVLGRLIRDQGPVLKLGVARHGFRVRAHAWIEIDGQPVNDPQGFTAFGEVLR
jgi:hypothetical protein